MGCDPGAVPHCRALGCKAVGLTPVYPQDAMRSVTKQAIREARLKEIKEELLHSEKLKVRASLELVLAGRDRKPAEDSCWCWEGGRHNSVHAVY